MSPVTRTRWAFSENGCCESASYAGTPLSSNLSSSMNGMRNESRSLGCDGPGHSPRGRKFSVRYLSRVRPNTMLAYLSSGGNDRFKTRNGQAS